MKVSIVTTLYNHRPFLKTNVRFMLSQFMRDFEWYILDDCSPDNGADLAIELTKHDSRVEVIKSNQNRGHAGVLIDSVMPELQGEYFYRQDGDDFCAPHFLETLAGLLDAQPSASVAAARCRYVDENDFVWGRSHTESYSLNQVPFFEKLLLGNFLTAPGVLYRMEDIRKMGNLYNPDIYSMDWSMHLHMALQGDFVYCGDALGFYRQHSGSWGASSVRDADWDYIYKGCFTPIDFGLRVAKNQGLRVNQELINDAFRHASVVAWRVCQKARQAGRKVNEEVFRRGILRYCPDFDFERDLTCRNWRQVANQGLRRFSKRHVSKLYPEISN